MENIREYLLNAEKQNLSPYARLAMNTKGRKREGTQNIDMPVIFIPSTLIGSISLVLVPEVSEDF